MSDPSNLSDFGNAMAADLPTLSPHITYGGTRSKAYWWKCSCGESDGYWEVDGTAPWEDPYDRTTSAHEHLWDEHRTGNFAPGARWNRHPVVQDKAEGEEGPEQGRDPSPAASQSWSTSHLRQPGLGLAKV